MKKEKKPEYVSKSGLKYRGWTETLIKKYLGEPDKEVDNPHYRCAAPMQLFDMKRVKRVEAGKRFAKDKEKAEKRRASSEKAVATKYENMQKWAENVEVDGNVDDVDDVFEQAINHYNGYHAWHGHDFQEATKDSSPDFLLRIADNYLRHECTNYEWLLGKLKGSVGGREAYYIIRDRVNDKVSELFDQLTKQEREQDKSASDLTTTTNTNGDN